MAPDDDRPPAWRRYLRLTREHPSADVDDELAFHLQSAMDELVAAGLSPAAAREAARRRFGDLEGIQQTLNTLSEQRERRMTRSEWFDAVRQDLAFGLRQLRKSPAFTVVAVLTLALGIGANSAIFSVVYSVLLNPLPYANGSRIVTLRQQNGQGQGTMEVPFGNYLVWQRDASAFEAIGARWGGGPATVTGEGEPTPISNYVTSSGYWKTMYMPPALGRYFTEAEDHEGAPPTVILSYALWQQRYKGDRSILGHVMIIDGRPTTIIGVAPQGFVLSGSGVCMWTELDVPAFRMTDFADHELSVVGLLKPGVTPGAAATQLRTIDTPLAKAHPHSNYDGGVAVTRFADEVIGPQRSLLLMLLGAVGCVLLIACVNSANLMLARAAVRRPEIAVRGALGASRRRIVMQLLTESLLVALAGGIAGLALGWAGVRFLVTAPMYIPRIHETTINGPVLAFTLALTLLCAVLFGLVPALRAARLDIQQTLRDGGRDAQGNARDRLRGGLVITELALAQVLLIAAGLLIRSSMRLQAVPAGFDTHNLLAASIFLPPARYDTTTKIEATFEQMDAAIAAVPGVKSVGRSQVVPIYGQGWNWNAFREGSDGHDEGSAAPNMRSVTPGYFATLGLPLLRGREFTRADGADAARVAIVSHGLAMKFWGTDDVVGKRISNGKVENPSWRDVVGVVADMHAEGLGAEPPLEMYMPSTQWVNGAQTYVIRGSVSVAGLTGAVRRAVSSVDPLLALTGVRTIDETIHQQMAMPRFTTALLTLLGITGLALAIVGVYGVIAYFVTQRTRELGVRIALGASSGSVQWLVVRRGLGIALIGVVVGGVVAFGAARLLQSMVFGVTPHDPVTFAAVAAVLTVVAAVASYIPARRATRIDPLAALRGS